MKINKQKIKSAFKNLSQKGFFSIIISQTLVKVIGFCNSIILARLLSKGDYGIYAYAFNILSVLLLLDGIGTISSVIQHGSEVSDNPSKQGAYSIFGFKIGIIFDLCLSVGILLYAAFGPLSIENANLILMIMSFQPIFSFCQNYFSANLRFRFENKLYSIMNVVAASFHLIGIVVGAVVGGVIGVVVGIYIGYALTLIVYLIVFSRIPNIYKGVATLGKNEKKSFVKLGISASINDSILHLIVVADIFLIGLMISNAEIVASYKVATTIPTALAFIPSSVMVFAYPYFAKKQKDLVWIKKNLSFIIVGLALVNAFIVAVLMIWAPFFIELVFGTKYLDAVTPFRILLIGYLFTGTIRTPLVNFLWSQKKNMYIILIAIITGLANIGLDIGFIYVWGVNGAAIATTSTYICASILSVILSFVQSAKIKKLKAASDIENQENKPNEETNGLNEAKVDMLKDNKSEDDIDAENIMVDDKNLNNDN